MDNGQSLVSDLSVNPDTDTSKSELKQIKAELLTAPPLLGKKVAISSSEADNFPELGINKLHLDDFIIEVNRYLLAAGASLIYGGDLRPGGLTEMLIELVDRYKFANQPQVDRLYSYLAFPITTSLSKEEEAKYAHRISFIKAAIPHDITVDVNQFVPPTNTQNLFIWARSLTQMREQMEEACDARIFAAGRASSYKGRAPGILEELLASLEHQTPIYLVGSYGGITRDVIAHLNGGELLQDVLSRIQASTPFVELSQSYKDHGLSNHMEWPEKIAKHTGLSWESITKTNGLTIDENKRLAVSIHVPEIIYYILKGILRSGNQNLAT